MVTSSENNKRIAKNTLLLYFRMLLTMAVSLYTSRVILIALGVDNFGIYNVVGGVVAMFSFINSSMSTATQRFLSYEIGRNGYKQLQCVFNTSILIHFIIALIIIVLAETIGMWFLYNKMMIPIERMNAAVWCYQFSLLTAVIMIMSVPYNAVIIAHEKMGAFAYISIVEVILKLLIAFSLFYLKYDKLIFYALLMFLVQLFIRIIYGQYCRRHFKEICCFGKIDKSTLKEMLSFAGFDLYGNLSVTVRTQGVNILLNMFFGPILNAASGIATQVQGAILNFANNIIMAVRPQVVKSYSIKDFNRVVYLLYKCSLVTFILLLMLSMPFIIEAHFILKLWLVDVPDYTASFCQLTLLFGLFANLSQVIIIGIHATGQIKRPSFINGTLYLLVIPISYISYKMGTTPEFAFYFNICAVIIGLLSNIWTLQINMPFFSFTNYIKVVLLRVFVLMIFFTTILCTIHSILEESFKRLLIICIISFILALISLFWILNKKERMYIINKIFHKKLIF